MENFEYNEDGQKLVHVVVSDLTGKVEGVFRSREYATHIATYDVSIGYVTSLPLDEADA